MKKNKATKFYEANINGSLARLVNVRRAMSNLKGDNFKHNRDIKEVAGVQELDFERSYCFIINASGKAIEVDSIEEAKTLFSNI